MDRIARPAGRHVVLEWERMKLPRSILSLAAASTFAAALMPSARAQASPQAETSAAIAGKKIEIKYSSPRMRGRKIMGGLVPFKQVWRTGADSATTMSTQANLDIGGLKIPKGNYTVYTIPTPTEWTLIISKELGQWGTDYHPKLDLGRTKMTVKLLSAPVENFKIDVTASGGTSGMLTMTWEKTQASVPVTVLP